MFFGIFDFDDEADNIGYEAMEVANIYIHKYLKDEFEENFLLYAFNRTNQVCFFLFSDEEFYKDDIEKVLASIISKIKRVCNISISVALSEETGLKDRNFRKCYRHAMRTLEYRTVVGKNNVLFFSDIQKEEVSIGKIDDNEYKTLSYDLSYGNIKECKEHVYRIVESIKSPEYADSYLYIASNITNSLLKSCGNFKDLYGSFMNNNEIIQAVYNAKTNETLINFYNSLIDAIHNINEKTRSSGVELGLKQILEYIDANYKNPDLSLESLSTDLGYSVSYISLLLKRNNNTFTKYLMSVRMEHAKILLNDANNKIISISEEVGYRDPY